MKVGLGVLGLFLVVSQVADAEPYRDGDVVVFLGDSITHGGRYHEYITDYYRTRFPEDTIRFVNSGIGGDTAAGALSRVHEDVAEYHPTRVTVHFGMNDVNRGAYSPKTTADDLRKRERAMTAYRANMRKLIDAIRKAAPAAKLTYLTPTPYDETAVVTNGPKTGWASANNIGCRTALSMMAGHVLELAVADKVESVDWFSPLNDYTVRHQKDDPHFSLVRSDRVHPMELGHSIMAWEFLKKQGVPSLVSSVEIDAGSARVVNAENAVVAGLSGDTASLSFTVAEKALPMPVAREALGAVTELGVENALNREILKVTGLAEGLWSLKIDGSSVGFYSASELAKGVGLGFNEKTPQYRQAQAVAARVKELYGREVVLRNHHSARWFFRSKAPVDDMTAFRRYYDEKINVKDSPEWARHFGRYIPGYLDYWPKYREVREALWKDQQAVRELAKPVPHKYELVNETARLKAVGIADGEIVSITNQSNWLRVDFVLRPTTQSFIRCALTLPPADKWDGRFWGHGNGGWAGRLQPIGMKRAAEATTDMGTSRHPRNVNPCDREILRDFCWRSTHLMTVEAKKLVKAYYGKAPHHSYFVGSSTGGGQGLCEAQRFPEDYDGIVAGVPAGDRLPRATMLWQERQLFGKYGKRFTPEQKATVLKAELDYFAKTDPEIARGKFIWDPYPTKGKLDGCWQAIVAADPSLAGHEDYWRGLFGDCVVRGRRLEPGALIGLELDPQWTFVLEKFAGPRAGGKDVTEQDILDFADNPECRFVDADLSAFAARGGKLVTYAGLSDEIVPARPVAEYFDRVARAAGGVDKAQAFMLHYLIPGRRHWRPTFTGDPENMHAKIVDWVEKGIRPEELTVRFVSEPKKSIVIKPYRGESK